MRHRKIKNLEMKFLDYQRFFVDEAAALKGGWRGVFKNANDIYLELGSGKGQFLIGRAEKHSDRNYIGFEGRRSVVFRALQKLDETELSNIRFACGFVNDPEDFFSESEISGLYLNFSDPWPKERHAGRRLAHRDYIVKYYRILKPGGVVEFKTDNAAFFEFAKAEFASAGEGMFAVAESTDDLHGSVYEAKNIISEYEEKFIEAGINIFYIKLIKKS